MVFAVMAGDFDMEQGFGVFAENDGEIDVALGVWREVFEIAAVGEAGYELGALDRINRYEACIDADLEGR